MDVPYVASGVFNAGNTFIVEISDAAGSFAAPLPIGSLSAIASGSITCSMNGSSTGSGFLVRVRSTDPVFTSAPSLTALTLAAPNAGMDGMVSVCTNAAPMAILDYLTGASPGGVWTDLASTGALVGPVLQPALLPPGTYSFIYMVEESGCTDVAMLTVVASAAPDAGSNASITVCSSDPPFTMYQQLGGSPMAGGAWASPDGAQLNGVFDPSTDIPGIYTYVVVGDPPCMNVMATLVITVNQAPDAGVDATVDHCVTDPAFLLFQQLGGTPSPAGTWTFNAAPHGPAFVPGTDMPGQYIYTVPGVAPCGSATAIVTVTEVSCLVNTPVNLGIPNVTE